MKRGKGILWGCLVLAAWGRAWAGIDSVGVTGAGFLKVMGSTRAAGMAGALAAFGGDSSAMDLNPAAAGSVPGLQLSAGQVLYFQGLTLQELSVASPFSWGSLGASLQMLASPEIQAVDAAGNAAGTFSLHDMQAGLVAARTWHLWNFGVAAHLLSESLAGEGAAGYAADLGLAGPLGAGWQAGLSLQNLGSLAALETQADPLPATLRLGLGWATSLADPNGFLVEGDVVGETDASPQVRLGAEARYRGMLYGRAGLQWSASYDNNQAYSLGFGFRYGGLQLDYSFVPYGLLGSSHRFSLTANLFEWLNPAEAPVAVGAPRNLVVRPADGRLSLSWSAPDGNPSGYFIYVRKGPGQPLQKLNSQARPLQAIAVAHLDSHLEYGVAVSAADQRGKEGPLSPEVNLRPESGAAPVMAVPLAPLNLRHSLEGDELVLAWDASKEEGITGYQVYFSDSSRGKYARLKPKAVPKSPLRVGLKVFRQTIIFIAVTAERQGLDGTHSSEFSKELKVNLRP